MPPTTRNHGEHRRASKTGLIIVVSRVRIPVPPLLKVLQIDTKCNAAGDRKASRYIIPEGLPGAMRPVRGTGRMHHYIPYYHLRRWLTRNEQVSGLRLLVGSLFFSDLQEEWDMGESKRSST